MRGVLMATALMLAMPAQARDLPVPAGKGWKHAETGLILMAALDGLPRTRLTDATADEHDIMAEFRTPDAAEVVTVYLFHPAVDDVAIWFERAAMQLENRAVYGDVAPTSPDPVRFAPPGVIAETALRRIYATGKRPYRATGLAVMPLGEWLVAIRVSSTTLKPGELDARLTRVVAGLRWPAGAIASPALVSITACPTPLAFKQKAKPVKSQDENMMALLLGSVASIGADERKAGGEATKPARWCRDPATTRDYGVYRNLDRSTGYMLALADAGRVVHVVPTLDTQTGKGDSYSVSLTDVDDSTISFPAFDHLPRPEQVVAALNGPRIGSAKGKNITINSDMLKQ